MKKGSIKKIGYVIHNGGIIYKNRFKIFYEGNNTGMFIAHDLKNNNETISISSNTKKVKEGIDYLLEDGYFKK